MKKYLELSLTMVAGFGCVLRRAEVTMAPQGPGGWGHMSITDLDLEGCSCG